MEMQEIHDAMEAIRQKKEKMQEVLRKRYGMSPSAVRSSQADS